MRMKYFSMQYFLWQCCSPRIPSSENMNTWRQGILTSSLMISHSTSRVWELVGVVLVPPMVPVHMHMTCLLLLWQHVSRLRWPSEWLQESFIMITVLCRNDKRIKLNEKKGRQSTEINSSNSHIYYSATSAWNTRDMNWKFLDWTWVRFWGFMTWLRQILEHLMHDTLLSLQ